METKSLERVLAEELPEWPICASRAYCDPDGEVRFLDSKEGDFYPLSTIRREDRGRRVGLANHQKTVTRAQWEAERARIAANQQAAKEAREIARTGNMTSEEQELAAIACGKRSKEDQALWDKVASDVFIKFSLEFESASEIKDTAINAMDAADAFMAERAKRMKG